MLALVGFDQRLDIEFVIDHQKVRALAFQQGGGGLRRRFDVRHLSAGFHGHLDRDRELAAQFAYD